MSLNEASSEFTWCDGPNNQIPAESTTACKLTEPVKLRINVDDDLKPKSIYCSFVEAVKTHPDHRALCFKKDGVWKSFTFQEYFNECNKAAKSFIKLGLDVAKCVSIIGFNSPEWFISYLGTVFAGGVGCGIYATNTSETCEYIFKDSESQIVVVENQNQLNKVLPLRDRINFKAIIQYSGEVTDKFDGLVMSWSEFINYGASVGDEELAKRIKTLAPNRCASLIYTSGTTGPSKAAMISHDNLVYLGYHIMKRIADRPLFNERIVSYLPLSHIAAQALDLVWPLSMGVTIYFAQPDALKGSLVSTLKEVKPTLFFGVPRVWEKIQDNIDKVFKSEKSYIKSSLISWARNCATQSINLRFHNQYRGLDVNFTLAKKLVLNKVLTNLGLEECTFFVSSAAPITKETLQFFISLGMPLVETLGMSELSAAHILAVPDKNRVTSVGCTDDKFNQTKLINVGEDGCGEICMTGRHVFMGYLNDPQKTSEFFLDDDWIKSGDLGKIDADGFLYVTGRLKEIVITAGGENIVPIPIENALKAELPDIISNCMLIGDKRKYLTMLVTLKSQNNPETLEPLDDLLPDCVNWLKAKGSNATKISEIIETKDKVLFDAMENALKKVNAKAANRASNVQKFRILPRDFSIFKGELGPTMKLRRQIVNKMYSEVIEEMYRDDNTDN